MTNLKDKILHALHNNKRLGTILDEVSNSQENLLKNHSNPVFNDKDKNKILRKHSNLQALGKSLYRYNSLYENNLAEVAQRESEINNMIALGAGRFREVLQGVESLINEEKTWSEAVKEYQADMAANKEGIELGKNNPNENCEIILKRVWPNKIETNY